MLRRKLIALISAALLSTSAHATVAGTPTTIQWGVDRTVTPHQVCAFDDANACQQVFTLTATGGTVLFPGVPQLSGPNNFTGVNAFSNTSSFSTGSFSGAVTFAGSNIFSAVNTFNANSVFTTAAFSGATTFTVNPTLSGCVGYPLSTGSAPFSCTTTIPATAFAAGAAMTNAQFFDVSAYGADPTGTNDSSTAFGNAMTACAALATGADSGATMRIPNGHWKLNVAVRWLPGCSIQADDKAYIFAGATISNLLYSQAGSNSDTLYDLRLTGGVWDCNSKVANGFAFPYFYHLTLDNFVLQNCNISSAIALGNTGWATPGNNNNKLIMHDYKLVNYGAQTPHIVTGNAGLNAVYPVANNDIGSGEIIGFDYGVYGAWAATPFHSVHVWNYSVTPYTTACFNFTTIGQTFLDHNECDGPVNTAAYLLQGSGADYHMSHNSFYSEINDNVAYAVSIGTGAIVTSKDDAFYGADNTHRIAQDFAGDLSRLSAEGTTTTNVVAARHSCRILTGYGDPGGNVVGSPCDQYLNAAGGASHTTWSKVTGTATNTGWVNVN